MNELIQADNCSIKNLENDSEFKQEKKRSRYEGVPLLLTVQLTISIIVLALLFTLKFLGIEYFNLIRSWYFENINNSLIVDSDFYEKEDTFKIKFPFINLQDEKHIVTTSFNSENDLQFIPIKLSVPLAKPIENGIITSKFGKRIDPLSGEEKFHYGLDLSSKEGSPIYAVMNGVVEKSEISPSLGNFLVIDHGNNIKSLYAHCKELKESVGNNVKRGQIIALMGNTGYYSTGTHVHIELIVNNQKLDPEPFFENINI